MRSHYLAQVLKKIADLLTSLPDTEIDDFLNYLNTIIEKSKQKKVSDISKQEIDDKEIEEVIQTIQQAQLDDIEGILKDKNLKVVALKKIAKHFNITISGRPKKDDIIHTIIKTLERAELDKTIRNSKELHQN